MGEPEVRAKRANSLALVLSPASLAVILLLRKHAWFMEPATFSYDFERRVNVYREEAVSPRYFGALAGALCFLIFVMFVVVALEPADPAPATRRRPPRKKRPPAR
jgi:hypothetical protein